MRMEDNDDKMRDFEHNMDFHIRGGHSRKEIDDEEEWIDQGEEESLKATFCGETGFGHFKSETGGGLRLSNEREISVSLKIRKKEVCLSDVWIQSSSSTLKR
jgi:hypothetical protein